MAMILEVQDPEIEKVLIFVVRARGIWIGQNTTLLILEAQVKHVQEVKILEDKDLQEGIRPMNATE